MGCFRLPQGLCTYRLFFLIFFGGVCQLWGRDLLRLGLHWRIGDGNTVNIFNDPWIPKPKLFRPISPLHPNSPRKVNELLLVNGSWNAALISQFLSLDLDDILLLPPLSPSSADRLVWHYSSNGIFSVKSCYLLNFENVYGDCESSASNLEVLWKNCGEQSFPEKS